MRYMADLVAAHNRFHAPQETAKKATVADLGMFGITLPKG